MRLLNLSINLILMSEVLMPECFIKFYMDFFSLSRGEAETRIREASDDDEQSPSAN